MITADDVCLAVEATLRAHLAGVVESLGWGTDLRPVTDWHQVPLVEALTSAQPPVGGIESPGLTGRPDRNGDGGYDGIWRVSVGVFDRGDDYAATQRRGRRWAMALTATILAYPSLGGLAETSRWVGQELNRIRQRDTVRTLSLGVAVFDIKVDNILDPATFLGAFPVVSSTYQTVTSTVV